MTRRHRNYPALLLAIALCGCGGSNSAPPTAPDWLFAEEAEEATTTTQASWSRVLEPRAFDFPRDHGAHPDYRIEWWYYTGNLTGDDGRQFGYQLTFFRTGINQEPQNPSRWAVRDLYTAHFAVSTLDAKRHRHWQRNNRAGIDQAGAKVGQLHVWNGDWSVTAEGDGHRLRAAGDGVELDLLVTPGKPVTLQGGQGLSQKGASEGNASYYYSHTRMESVGTVTIDGKPLPVTGQSWMDHEFSTSFLEPGQLGWDWFSVQLDDGWDLMLYQMRGEDGTADPYSSGTLVGPDGEATHLTADEFTLTPGRVWTSPDTGAPYPMEWEVSVPGHNLKLSARSAFDEQEMVTLQTTGIAYWEGSIELTGEHLGRPVIGRGYLELTGYKGIGLGSLLAD